MAYIIISYEQTNRNMAMNQNLFPKIKNEDKQWFIVNGIEIQLPDKNNINLWHTIKNTITLNDYTKLNGNLLELLQLKFNEERWILKENPINHRVYNLIDKNNNEIYIDIFIKLLGDEYNSGYVLYREGKSNWTSMK